MLLAQGKTPAPGMSLEPAREQVKAMIESTSAYAKEAAAAGQAAYPLFLRLERAGHRPRARLPPHRVGLPVRRQGRLGKKRRCWPASIGTTTTAWAARCAPSGPPFAKTGNPGSNWTPVVGLGGARQQPGLGPAGAALQGQAHAEARVQGHPLLDIDDLVRGEPGARWV